MIRIANYCWMSRGLPDKLHAVTVRDGVLSAVAHCGQVRTGAKWISPRDGQSLCAKCNASVVALSEAK